MDRPEEKAKMEGEGRDERKRGATDKDASEAGIEEHADMSYSELIKTLNSLSKQMKDGKNPSIEPQKQSSSRSNPTPSSSKEFTPVNHALLCDSLDNLITHYLMNYLSGAAEDKLMKSDLENVRSYLRRKKIKKQDEMKRNEVNRPTARRFIMNGIRSNINSTGKIDEEDKDKSDEHKKVKLDQSQNNPLPEIRKVIKNPNHSCEDEEDDDDDGDLKIYDD